MNESLDSTSWTGVEDRERNSLRLSLGVTKETRSDDCNDTVEDAVTNEEL